MDCFLLKLYISLLQKPVWWLGKPSWELCLLRDPCSSCSNCPSLLPPNLSSNFSQVPPADELCLCPDHGRERRSQVAPWIAAEGFGNLVLCCQKAKLDRNPHHHHRTQQEKPKPALPQSPQWPPSSCWDHHGSGHRPAHADTAILWEKGISAPSSKQSLLSELYWWPDALFILCAKCSNTPIIKADTV